MMTVTLLGDIAHGYDGAKKLSDRNRHLLVDTTGLQFKVVVHLADIQEREGVSCCSHPMRQT
jgi:putative transposase